VDTGIDVPEPAVRDHRYAIVVGIDRYPGFRDLGGPCNDAEAFAAWLRDPAGGDVPAANIRLLVGRDATDVQSARPVKRDIDIALHELVTLVRAARAPCRLYLYFAGHGVAAGLGTAALLMADAERGLCWNLSLAPYRAWLERCRDFSEVILFCDCCRTLMPDVPEGTPPHETCPEPYPFPQQAFVALAADLGEPAYETNDRGHFTAALLDGLRGAASDATGSVRADMLAGFLDATLAEADPPQRADTTVIGSPLTLATVAPRLTEIVIDVRAGPARQVSVLGPGGAVVAVDVREPGPWRIGLGLGLYEIEDPEAPPILFKVGATPQHVQG
jgi:hypothetical protein